MINKLTSDYIFLKLKLKIIENFYQNAVYFMKVFEMINKNLKLKIIIQL